ncbi:MAG: hypothetical protein AVDCRST_MAG68-1711, partial [uncultured Gemmatimonadetes bacterium]
AIAHLHQEGRRAARGGCRAAAPGGAGGGPRGGGVHEVPFRHAGGADHRLPRGPRRAARRRAARGARVERAGGPGAPL